MQDYKHVTFREFVTKMFMSNTGVSSKRVCGFVGGFVCIFICLYCTFLCMQAPVVTETLFYCSAALLGLDTVTRIGKKQPKENQNNEETTDQL